MAFLGINVGSDKEQLARLFVKLYKVPYPVGRDVSGAIVGAYRVEATPTTLFIDRAGRLLDQVVGGLEPEDLGRKIERLLG